jgi:hypothetical protein
VVVAGLTVILAVVCPPGAQLNVPPVGLGVAVNVVLLPAQIVASGTVTVGIGLTVTVPASVAVHPFRLYVTV